MQPRLKRPSIGLPLILLTLVISLGLTSACATEVPPRVAQKPIAPIDRSEGIYVIAAKHRDRINESLTQAGLIPVDKPTSGGYALEVRVGSSRSSGTCGTVHNISYILTAAGGRVMVIKGRGPTGACPENIFNGMSELLAANTTE
jgi:hypothetical protein